MMDALTWKHWVFLVFAFLWLISSLLWWVSLYYLWRDDNRNVGISIVVFLALAVSWFYLVRCLYCGLGLNTAL